jgi:hypothetical protein
MMRGAVKHSRIISTLDRYCDVEAGKWLDSTWDNDRYLEFGGFSSRQSDLARVDRRRKASAGSRNNMECCRSPSV